MADSSSTGAAAGAGIGSIIPGVGTAIGAGLGSILGGIFGSNNSAGQAHNDQVTANNILQEIQAAPDISKPLILQKYAQAGILTPAMEQNITAQLPTNIVTDPRYKSAQMQALQQMQQRANTGFTQGDRAALNQAQLQAQGDTKSRLASIQQDMQQKGLSDSGTALAMKLAAAQNEANQMSTNANQQAMMSQNAREQALGNLGQFANQSQNQDFGQQLAQQQAQQQMQRFNIQNQLGVQQANVNAQNQAQAANLGNAQNVSNQNVSGQNQEMNNQLARQMAQYGANVGTSQIKAGGFQNLANQEQGNANNQAQAGVNLGSGLGQIVGGGINSIFNSKPKAAYDGGKMDYKYGGEVPGRAPVGGDSPANDIVHAVLSPGEIVIPRTLSESKFGKHILKIIEAHNALKRHTNGEE